VTNLAYLLFLNDVAGRTFADMSQYPVVPWVLKDFSSAALDLADPSSFRDLAKPIGALNPARLRAFRERYADMPREEERAEGGEGAGAGAAAGAGAGAGAPFLYGTHYSTPAYTLHYLVRAMPEHQLRLQSGRFDAPDRLFYDVAASWAGVAMSGNSDLKELVPEFYTSDGSFLLTPDGLDLGIRQNGRRVGDVALPPWAIDAGDFVAQSRDALESELVGAALHNWIDLIFGYKQRGEEAERADNVFHVRFSAQRASPTTRPFSARTLTPTHSWPARPIADLAAPLLRGLRRRRGRGRRRRARSA
jgi:factor associated with neutral sphingomyelinase activation